jgi:excisionase family DNA binding protein
MCTSEKDLWLSTTQAARRLGVSPNHVRRLIEQGRFRARDVGVGSRSYYQVSSKSLDQYMAEAEV